MNQDSNPVSGGWPVSSFGLVLASTALALVMVLGAGRGARAQDEPEFDPFDFTTPAPDEEPAEGEAAAPGAVDPATPEFPAIPGGTGLQPGPGPLGGLGGQGGLAQPGGQGLPGTAVPNPRNDIERYSVVSSEEALTLYNEALELIERGDTTGAMAKLQESATLDQRFAAAHYELAQLLTDIEDYSNAQLQMQIVGQLIPGPVAQVYAAQAELELKMRQYTQAAETYLSASNLDYMNVDLAVRAGEARLLEALNSRARAAVLASELALGLLDRALTMQPDNPKALQVRARIHALRSNVNAPGAPISEQDAEKSVADFTRAIELDPNNLQAAAQLGQVLYGRALHEGVKHLGSESKMLEDLRRAPTLLERFYTQQLESTTREQRREQAEDLARDELTAYQAMAVAGATYIKLGMETEGGEQLTNLQRGAELCRKAIEEEPQAATGYFQLGMSYRMMGDLPRAITAFSDAISLDPANAEAYLRRGICHVHARSLEQAKGDFQRAMELSPRPDARASFWMGVVEAQQGNHEEAVRLFSNALDLTRSNYPLASLNRGLSYWQLGDRGRAERDFSEVLTRDPGNQQARQLRDALRRVRPVTRTN